MVPRLERSRRGKVPLKSITVSRRCSWMLCSTIPNAAVKSKEDNRASLSLVMAWLRSEKILRTAVSVDCLRR